ncbi:MAG TPA: sugar ABC transporter permease [Chloroflexia bacterium]|nr:sugar ABC transporter permease [Chloroflexia bacterium]
MTNNYFGKGWLRFWPYIGMAPALLLYLLFGLGPSLATAVFSLTNITGVTGAPWDWVGLQNYVDFLGPSGGSRDNYASLGRTAIFCISVTLIQNGLSLLLAILLNSRLKGHLFFRSLFFMPTVLGVTIIGLIWTLFFYIGGPADVIFTAMGINTSFLGDNNSAFFWVIFIQIWQNLGFSMVIFMAGLQTISKELYEAGRIDGASRWALFRYVTFPLLSSSVTINVLLAVIGSLQTYQLIYVLTSGQHNTSTLAYQIFNAGFGGNISTAGYNVSATQGYAAAIAMVQFVFVLIVTLITQWYLRRRETQL